MYKVRLRKGENALSGQDSDRHETLCQIERENAHSRSSEPHRAIKTPKRTIDPSVYELDPVEEARLKETECWSVRHILGHSYTRPEEK
jgi:hypothetical protein